MKTAKVVKDKLSSKGLVRELNSLARKVLHDIEARKDPGFSVPNRGADNIFYDERKDVIHLGAKESRRAFHNVCILCGLEYDFASPSARFHFP